MIHRCVLGCSGGFSRFGWRGAIQLQEEFFIELSEFTLCGGGQQFSKYPPAKPGALVFVSRSKRHVRSLRLLETPKGVGYISFI